MSNPDIKVMGTWGASVIIEADWPLNLDPSRTKPPQGLCLTPYQSEKLLAELLKMKAKP